MSFPMFVPPQTTSYARGVIYFDNGLSFNAELSINEHIEQLTQYFKSRSYMGPRTINFKLVFQHNMNTQQFMQYINSNTKLSGTYSGSQKFTFQGMLINGSQVYMNGDVEVDGCLDYYTVDREDTIPEKRRKKLERILNE